MKKNVFVLAGLMAFAGWSAAAAPNLVVNGSFESTVQKNHTWGTYTSLPGWTGLPTIEVRNNVAGRAQERKKFRGARHQSQQRYVAIHFCLGFGRVELLVFGAAENRCDQ